MKPLYSIQHKGKIALLLFLLILLEMLNGLSHKSNMLEMNDSFSEIYKDRLLAQNYIHQLTEQIYLKKIRIVKSSIPEKNVDIMFLTGQNDVLKKIIRNYEQTKFTIDERHLLNSFKTTFGTLTVIEKEIAGVTNQIARQQLLNSYEQSTNNLLSQLQQLTNIQLVEAARLNNDSKRIFGSEIILSRFNWTLIIIIGVIIQALIFTSKSTLPKMPQNELLN